MPELPAFLADLIEPRFARRATVAMVLDLAPRLRRVRFQCDALRGSRVLPGDEVEFRVSDRAFRHYTVARFDVLTGTFDVVFFLHGGGPGSSWAAALRTGQSLSVLGPGGGLEPTEAPRRVFLGDETALGLFACLFESDERGWAGAIEAGPEAGQLPTLVELGLLGISRSDRRGDALGAWLEQSSFGGARDTAFYLAGHAGSVSRLRRWLLASGVPRRNLRCKAHWADGKRGL